MGGAPSSSGGGTTTTQQIYSPEETAQRNKIQSEAGNIYDSTKGSYTADNFPGAKPAPFSEDTLQAQQALRAFSQGQGQTLANQTGKALQFGMSDVLNPASNPALQQTIDTTTRKIGESYTDPNGVLAQIRGNFTAGNSGGSGTREGVAGGIAGRSYLNAVGDATGKITSDAYNQGLDTFSKTLAFAPTAYGLMTQPALTQAALGQQQEGMTQANLNYDASKAAWGLNAPWQGLNNYANVIYAGSNPTVQTTSTGTAPSSGGNGVMGAAGLAMQGAALGSAIPGVGTAVGAGAGLLMGLFGGH